MGVWSRHSIQPARDTSMGPRPLAQVSPELALAQWTPRTTEPEHDMTCPGTHWLMLPPALAIPPGQSQCGVTPSSSWCNTSCPAKVSLKQYIPRIPTQPATIPVGWSQHRAPWYHLVSSYSSSSSPTRLATTPAPATWPGLLQCGMSQNPMACVYFRSSCLDKVAMKQYTPGPLQPQSHQVHAIYTGDAPTQG